MEAIKIQETISTPLSLPAEERYQRYHIHTETAPNIVPWPSRFNVRVNRPQLAMLLLKELVQFRGDLDVVLSRPCMYGVFSGPVGGFAPRQQYCVGCLRCTTQYPHIVRIEHNPERQRLGDSYFTFSFVNAVSYEAETGSIPVKGAGYRGRFGGEGWEGMWTDMSEIVRPTRDGIHGREFISTVVDVGTRPSFLSFDSNGRPTGPQPRTFSIPVPILFDLPPASTLGVGMIYESPLCQSLSQAAHRVGSLAILPLASILEHRLTGDHLVPLVSPEEAERLLGERFVNWPSNPRLIELNGWDKAAYQIVDRRFPESVIAVRLPFGDPERLLDCFRAGVRVFHLIADYHGRGSGGEFVHDLIRQAHGVFVQEAVRDEVTLLGSGGIIAAEHVPKAIIAGLDAVALDTPLLVAMQAEFDGECIDWLTSRLHLPEHLAADWGAQRLMNLTAAWRDQLLEVLGAMGLREVRRLRGEVGRAMYQRDLEREAFAGIEGYDA